MKNDPITRAYEGLSYKERAALAFDYCARLNELEAHRITSTVPRASYTNVVSEYRHWFETFTRLASWWNIVHWQAMARWIACRSDLAIMADCNEAEPRLSALQVALEVWESRLLGLDMALNEAGDQHGFDPDAVRNVSGAEVFKPCQLSAPLPKDFDVAREAIKGIIEGAG